MMNDNPYAAPDHGIDRHNVEMPSLDENNFVPVGFWKRLVAYILDQILIGIACIPFAILIVMSTDSAQTAKDLSNLVKFVVGVTAILLFWKFKQATPGKMVFNSRIVDAQTFGKPAFGKLVLRYVGYIVSALVLGLGFIWIAFDKRKRGWHDLMAGTLVVTPKPQSERRATRPVPKSPAPPAG